MVVIGLGKNLLFKSILAHCGLAYVLGDWSEREKLRLVHLSFNFVALRRQNDFVHVLHFLTTSRFMNGRIVQIFRNISHENFSWF